MARQRHYGVNSFRGKPVRSPRDGAAGKSVSRPGRPSGTKTLFILSAPNPDEIIGVRPTRVSFKPLPHAALQSGGLLAAGLTFVDKDVDVKKIRLTQSTVPNPSGGTAKCSPLLNPCQPCFDNDATLSAATFGIHLPRVNQSQNGHEHANLVWGKMEEMYIPGWGKQQSLSLALTPQDALPAPAQPRLGRATIAKCRP
jgi:hypothetical protein